MRVRVAQLAQACLQTMAELALFTVTIEDQTRLGCEHRRNVTEVSLERLCGKIQRVPNMAGREVRRFAGVQKNNSFKKLQGPKLIFSSPSHR